MPELHVPPLATEDLPGIGGRIGPEPEHFCVEELPLYETSGEGEHCYVFMEKRSATTQDLIQAVARAAGVRPQDVGSAGMKDKHAVTRQWLSLPSAAQPPEGWLLPDFARTLSVSRHKNKLRTGHLRANRFRITLVDVFDGALESAQKITALLHERGLPNYYGPQRFGRRGSGFEQAFEWLRRGEREPNAAAPDGARRRRPRGRGNHFQSKLLSSVVQSDVFNRYLTARLARPEPLLPGEVVRLDGSSRHFVVEDAALELPRLEQGDIHRTGPLLGPRTVQAAAAAAELELAMRHEAGLTNQDLVKLETAAPGARRDLLVRPEDLTVEQTEPSELVVSFVLPAGSYATQLLRELTRAPWLDLR